MCFTSLMVPDWRLAGSASARSMLAGTAAAAPSTPTAFRKSRLLFVTMEGLLNSQRKRRRKRAES